MSVDKSKTKTYYTARIKNKINYVETHLCMHIFVLTGRWVATKHKQMH